MPTNVSLLNRVRIFLALLVLFVGVPVAVTGSFLVYEQSQKGTLQTLKERAPLVVQLIENDISAKLQALTHAAKLLQVQRIGDVSQQQLDSIVSGFSGVIWAGVADEKGKVLLAHEDLIKGANVSQRPWFREGMSRPSVLDRHDAVLLAKLLPNREDPYQFIDIAVPILSVDGQTLGVLALHLDWIWYQKRFSELLGHSASDALISYLVVGQDDQPRLLNSSSVDSSLISSAMGSGDLQKALGNDFYSITERGPEGGVLDSLDWTLLVLQNKDFTRQSIVSFAVFGMLTFLFALMAATILFLKMTRQVSQTSSQFIDALSEWDIDQLNRLRPDLPQEVLPLSSKAELLIADLREKRLSLEQSLDAAKASVLDVNQMIGQAPLAIAMFDLDMRYVACSQIWISQYLPHEPKPLGKSQYELFPQMSEDWRQAHEAGLKGHIIKKENGMWVGSDGRSFWLDWTIQPWTNHDGSVGGIIIITEDVTEEHLSKVALAKSEERFQLAMLGSHDGLWDWNIETEECYFSPSWMSMLGYRADEISAGVQTWSKLLHPDDAAQAEKTLRETLGDPQKTEFTETFRMAHKQGHWVTVLSRSLILRDERGNAIRMVGTHLDRTEVEHLQLELNDAWIFAQAEARSNELKSRFLATVSHEIRNPLNSVCGFARLLRDEVKEPELRRYAQMLMQTTDSLTLVLNDLLDFAKIDAGKLELNKEPFSLAAVTDEISESARLLCQEKGVAFEYSQRWGGGSCYMGDSVRIRQILQNLISNAIKFTAQGQVGLRVFAVSKTPTENTITIEVSDSGIGIPADKLDKLFKPFSQLHSDNMSRYGGTGLGLTIVKSLVDMMGGDLQCESISGQGSKFTVMLTLPVTAAAIDVAVIKHLPTVSRQILVADDSPVNVKVLSTFLQKRGHVVTTADNGEVALQRLQEHEYDYVLLDMDMPGLSGLEVVNAIKTGPSLNYDSHFACLSGHAGRSMTEMALGGGFERFFTKPLNFDDVLRYVHGETLVV